MKVITVHSQKGGSGKSLLSLSIAVAATRAGLAVAVIDLDPQCSSTQWHDSREATAPYVTSIQPSRLRKTLDAARADGVDLVVIDTPPHTSDTAITAAELSDLLLIPCRPSVFDLRSLANTARIAKIADKPTYVVISQAPRAPRQIEDAVATVRQAGLNTSPVIIHQRSAYSHASTVGMTASEWEPGGKAAGEIDALLTWVRQTMTI